VNLFEYEAKQIFKRYGICVPKGVLLLNLEDVKTIQDLNFPLVLKAQIPEGRREKQGGIIFVDNYRELESSAEVLFGRKINGYTVNKILLEEKAQIKKEFYLSLFLDPCKRVPLLVSSSKGGVLLEELLGEHSDDIASERIDIIYGLGDYKIRNVLLNAGIPRKFFTQITQFVKKTYMIFREYDAELVEINPLAQSLNDNFIALDAKITIDDNALFRHKGFQKKRNRYISDLEYEAAIHDLNYVQLNGNIGVLCTGAGLTLSTIDLIKEHGGNPANFLEFGGATYKNSYYALKVVLSDTRVKVIFVRTFGLVARADSIAQGLVKAVSELKPKIPIFAVVRGTNENEARRILTKESKIRLFEFLEEAIREVVKIGKRQNGNFAK